MFDSIDGFLVAGRARHPRTATQTQKGIFLFLVIAFILGEFSDWFVRESNKRKWLDRWSVSAISCWGLFFICAHQSSNGQRLSFLSLFSFLFLFFLISSPFFIARLTRPALAVVAFQRGCCTTRTPRPTPTHPLSISDHERSCR